MQTIQPSFSKGEISPALFGRVDVSAYQVGLAEASNAIVHSYGGVSKRPGLRFIETAKQADKPPRLIPFQFNIDDAYVLEFSEDVIRFLRDDSWVQDSEANDLEVPHPFAYSELKDIRYVQSGDVIALVHFNHPPYELRRLANDNWELRAIDFSPQNVDPINLEITVNDGGSVDQRYRITGTTAEGTETLPIVANPETVNQINFVSGTVPPVVTTYGTNTLVDGDEIELRNMGRFLIGNTVVKEEHPLNNRRFIVQNRTATTFELYTTEMAPADSDSLTFTTVSYDIEGLRTNGSPLIVILAGLSFNFQVGNPIQGPGIPAGSVVHSITGISSFNLGDADGNLVNATSSGTDIYNVRALAGRIHKTFYETSGNASPNNTLNWTPIPGIRRYSIYRQINGTYGLIGETGGSEFTDNNIAPTTSVNPPNYREPFLNQDDYPTATSFFQQRRVLGGSRLKPDTSEFSRTGDFNKFSRSFPLQDDDAITVTLSSNLVNQIQHYVSQRDLIIFTDSTEWTISGGGEGGLTPSTITQRLQSNWGSSRVPPLVVDTRVVFNTPDGSGVRDIGYSFEIDGYRGTDLAIFSSHLFDAKTITAWDYSAHPEGRVWVVRDDGVGLCLSVELDQQINAWTRIITDGEFEDVIVIRRRLADDIYWVVKREIDGNTVRYIEKMNDVFVSDYRESFLVDSGLSYDGSPVSSVSGLDHLEGETVVALADGTVIDDLVVASGSVALGASYSKVTVGLPYTCRIKTLRIEVPQQTVQNKLKRIHKIAIRFYRSRGLEVGPSLNFMTPLREEEFYEEWEDTGGLYSGDREIVVDTSWNTKGQLFLQQSHPLPFTVLAVMPSWDVEDGM